MAEGYKEILDIGEGEEKIVEIETVYKRKPKTKAVHRLKWINHLEYKGHEINVMVIGDKVVVEYKWYKLKVENSKIRVIIKSRKDGGIYHE